MAWRRSNVISGFIVYLDNIDTTCCSQVAVQLRNMEEVKRMQTIRLFVQFWKCATHAQKNGLKHSWIKVLPSLAEISNVTVLLPYNLMLYHSQVR